ncbi:hypothetical protein KHS38_00460 [Mucilaginibacter sp. Bleaf8]|uniref:hypothetical protein n=1 Tax=Mucilaginibacter sp. Bleaf8 TaxID=2834430 RepID=UPI001BCE9A9A|nr:hypothetical protein [Mucilaginibacter sp. Bleaf8]MBS7562861.1 hypothetical protein [Mucilaginibacter sp. Bleaf8]
MTPKSTLSLQLFFPALLSKQTLVGATVALTLMAFFIAGVKHPDPTWGKLWMIRPLVFAMLAGAAGGTLGYFMNILRKQKGWNKALTFTACLVAYVIAIWMGSVLGLDGTLWN